VQPPLHADDALTSQIAKEETTAVARGRADLEVRDGGVVDSTLEVKVVGEVAEAGPEDEGDSGWVERGVCRRRRLRGGGRTVCGRRGSRSCVGQVARRRARCQAQLLLQEINRSRYMFR